MCRPAVATRPHGDRARRAGCVPRDANDVLDDLHWRGLIAQSTDATALRAALAAGPVTFYCGFDPTAPSLHVGQPASSLTLRAAPAGRATGRSAWSAAPPA